MAAAVLSQHVIMHHDISTSSRICYRTTYPLNTEMQRLHANHCKTETLAYLVCILAADATVKLDPWVDSSIVTHLSQLAYLLHLVLDELLATKARVHCTVQNRCQHMSTARLCIVGGVCRPSGGRRRGGKMGSLHSAEHTLHHQDCKLKHCRRVDEA